MDGCRIRDSGPRCDGDGAGGNGDAGKIDEHAAGPVFDEAQLHDSFLTVETIHAAHCSNTCVARAFLAGPSLARRGRCVHARPAMTARLVLFGSPTLEYRGE